MCQLREQMNQISSLNDKIILIRTETNLLEVAQVKTKKVVWSRSDGKYYQYDENFNYDVKKYLVVELPLAESMYEIAPHNFFEWNKE